MKCISGNPSPFPVHKIYRWFNAVTHEEMQLMEAAIKAGIPTDILHPLRHTTALMEATRLGRARAAKWLIAHGAAPGLLCGTRGTTPLHAAIRQGNTELTETMLHVCGHVGMVDHSGRTLMHMLAQFANRSEEAAWLRIAHSVISKQLQLDVLDSEGITALHYALIHEWAELAEMLLQNGANPNALALDTGVSPLLMAALNQQRKMVRLLLQHGANPYLAAGDGKTALALMPDIQSMLTGSTPADTNSLSALAQLKRPGRKPLN